MADETSSKPEGNSNVEGIFRTIKNLPIGGKIAIGAIVAGVALVAYIGYRNSQNSSASSVPASTAQTSLGSTLPTSLAGTYNPLDQLYGGPTPTSSPPAPTASPTSPVISPVSPSVPAPPPIGTPGYSTNRYIYTTVAGDTLNSLTQKASWTPSQQIGGGPGFLYNYNGNAPIFSAIGASVANPDAPLPVGTKISL